MGMQSSMEKFEQRLEKLAEMVVFNRTSERLNTVVLPCHIPKITTSENCNNVRKLLPEQTHVTISDEDISEAHRIERFKSPLQKFTQT